MGGPVAPGVEAAMPADPQTPAGKIATGEPLRHPGEPEIIALLDKVAKNCDVQPWGARVTCPNREEDEVRNWHLTRHRSITQTLDTFTMYIVMHDEKGQAVAVDALRRIVNNLDPKDFDLAGDLKLALEPALWHHFYRDIQMIDNPRLFIALDSSLAILAALAKQEPMLFMMLEKLPALRLRSIPHLMRFARLRPFEGVKQLAANAVAAGDLALTKACLSSAARMHDVTAEEQKILCPWAGELFAQAPGHLWTSVAGVFRSCPAEALEPLAAHLEKEWLPEKALAGEVAVVGDLIRAHCPPAPDARPAPDAKPLPAVKPAPGAKPATDASVSAVCARLKKIVAKIKDSPKTRPEVRKVCEGALK